ncbi:MAG: hypothetical protein PSY14_01015 [bacterium]|nr:hypothetical protein [bacterium]
MEHDPKKPARTLSANFHGVAAYDPLSDKAAPASYKTVVAGLTRDRLDKFFFPDLQKHSLDPVAEKDKSAISLLEGTHPMGFRVSMIAAQDGDKRVYMPMIDDTLRNMTLLVGPGPAGKSIADAVTYIDGSEKDASKKINEFLADGARLRGEMGKLNVSDAYELVEDLIRAVSASADVTLDHKNNIATDTTVGDVMAPIARGQKEVTLYAVAAQTSRKFKL